MKFTLFISFEHNTCYSILYYCFYLSLNNSGDIVLVLEKREDGWWRGILNNREGLFPGGYCEELSPNRRVLNIDTKKTAPNILFISNIILLALT